jgi:competence protein ComEC
MAAFNPLLLWDPGFQLSFFATLGLILYAEPFSQVFVAFAGRRLPASSVERLTRPVTQYLLFTLAASITTLPVIAYHFHRLSLVSLIANLLILPVQPAVMVLGGLALLLGTLYFSLGQLAAWLAWPFVVYTIRAVEWFAGLRGATLDLGAISAPAVIAMYAALFALTFAGARIKQAAAWVKPGLALAIFGVIAVLVWREALAAPDNRLHLTLLDTNTDLLSGDAILIQTPSGRELLVNGGPSATRLSDALGRRLPLSDRRLDFLLVADPVKGQVAALPRIIERFPPANVLWAGQPDASPESISLQQALIDAHISITPAGTGQVLQLGQGAELRVLAAGERGAVFLLAWGNFRALLPLGVNFDDLEALGYGRQIGPVTALLLADSGYAPSNPPEWIANLRPQVVLLSVAPENREGLPSPETLESVQDYTLLRTDQNGWIELTTDGEQLWVEVEGR